MRHVLCRAHHHRWQLLCLSNCHPITEHHWIGSLFLVVSSSFRSFVHSFTLVLALFVCSKVLISDEFYTILPRMNICIFQKNFPLLLGNFCFFWYSHFSCALVYYMLSVRVWRFSWKVTNERSIQNHWVCYVPMELDWVHCVVEKKQQTIQLNGQAATKRSSFNSYSLRCSFCWCFFSPLFCF